MSESSTASTASSALERRARAAQRIALGSLLASGGALAVALVAVLRGPAPVVPMSTAPPAAAMPNKLDELTVHRLNVVEPDGTPRMIIASRARFPGAFTRGKEIARPDRTNLAGILFVDDEGTENGGLVQSGLLDKDGKVRAGLSLTFDRFRQDQMLQLLLEEGGDDARAGMIINDRPSYKVYSVDDMVSLQHETERLSQTEREALVKRHVDLGHLGQRRAYLGIQQGSSKLVLNDPQGRPRMTLRVSERGEPTIELLDETGRAVRTIDAHKP